MISNNNQSEISSPFDSNLTTTEILPVSGTGSSLSTIQWIDGSRTYNDLFLNGYDTPNEETITWDLPSSFYVKTLKIQVNNFERETLEIKTGLATSGTVTEGSTVSGSYLSTQACDGSVWRINSSDTGVEAYLYFNLSYYISDFNENNVISLEANCYARGGSSFSPLYFSLLDNEGTSWENLGSFPSLLYDWINSSTYTSSSEINAHIYDGEMMGMRFLYNRLYTSETTYIDYAEIHLCYMVSTGESVSPSVANLQVRAGSVTWNNFDSNNISTITGITDEYGPTIIGFRIDNPGGNPNSTHQINAEFDVNFTYEIMSRDKVSTTQYTLASNEIDNQTWTVNVNVESITGHYSRNFTSFLPITWDGANLIVRDPSSTVRTGVAIIQKNSNNWSVTINTADCDQTGTWTIEIGSLNLLKDQPIGFWKNGNWIEDPYYAPTDTIRFNASLNYTIPNPSENQANITIYDANNQLVNEASDSCILSSGYLVFNGTIDWTVSSIIGGNIPGNYTVSISYFNGTEIGFRNSSFLCKFKSNITKLSPYGQNATFDWSPAFDLVCKVKYHNESDINQGIGDATYTNYTFGNSTLPIIDSGTLSNVGGEIGNYTFTINKAIFSTLTLNLTYQLNITMDSPKHQRKFVSYNVELRNASNLKIRAFNFTEGPVFGSYELNDGDYFYSLYPENITIYANYSVYTNGSGISPAMIICQIGTESPQTLDPVGSPGNYTINLFSNDTIFDYARMNSPILIHLEARSLAFATFTFNFYWVIQNASSILTNHNSSSFEVMGGDTFNLMLEYEDDSHVNELRYWINDLDNTNVTVKWGNASMQLKSIDPITLININGTYQIPIKFDVYKTINFNLSISFQRVGYEIASFTFNVTIRVYNTSLINLDWEQIITLYENLDFSFLYQYNLSGSWFPITDSNFIMDSNYTIQGYNHFEAGTYNATLITNLQTTGFNAGNYAANVSLNRTNNQYYDFLFPFTIRNNHTTSNLLNSEYQDYKIIQGKKYYQMVTFVNQSINLTTSYLNDEVDSKGIDDTGIYLNVSIYDGSKIEKTWNDFQYLGNGNYKITINNSDYEIGEYFVNISFRKQNYDWNFILINLTIDPFHSNLTFFNTTLQNIVVNNIITNWYQHNISFKIQWYSTIYNSTNPYFGINQIISNVNTNPGMIIWSIKDASNNTLIFGNNMIFDSITEMWKINDSDLPVPLKDIEGSGEYLEPGDYQLFVNISGLYLKNMTKIFIIKILPKAQTNIEISGIPADTQVATYINIKIKFTFDNQVPSNYYNIIVNLTLIIYYDDGRVVTQDLVFGDIKAQGTEQKQIFVEFGVNRISLRIFYYSDDQDWPFFSATNFDTNYISIEVGNIFKILVPILILGVIGICGFIGYSFYRTRIKQKREQKILDKSEKIFNYFNDLINIRKISMINKKNGEVLYNQNFNKADFSSEIQEDIIIKINNLGDKKGYYSSIDIIRHEGFIIIVDDSTYIRSAFIMKEFPTDDFIRGLIKFVQYYELNNLNEINKGKKLENGLETHALLEYIFDIGVIEPHRVTGKGIKMNLSSFQIELLSMAQEMSYDGYFFVSALFDKIKNESLLPEMSIFKEIMLLIQKKAIERIPYDDLSTIEIKYYEPEKDSIEKAIIQTEIESKSKDLRKDLTIKKVEDIKTKVEEFEEPISTKKEVSEEEILTPFEKMKLEYVLTPEEEKTLSELHESDLEIDLPLLDIEPEIKLPKAEDETDIKLPKAEDETDIKLPKAEDDED